MKKRLLNLQDYKKLKGRTRLFCRAANDWYWTEFSCDKLPGEARDSDWHGSTF